MLNYVKKINYAADKMGLKNAICKHILREYSHQAIAKAKNIKELWKKIKV